MGKLGKKARKFAKKNLQSVMKRKRKMNTLWKKKNPSKDKDDVVEEQGGDASVLPTGRNLHSEGTEDTSLDILTNEEDYDMVEDSSDSEGYLSEDPSCPYIGGNEHEVYSEDISQGSGLSAKNQQLQSEISEKKKRLEALKRKDPDFAIFLQDHIKDHESLRKKEMSDEDEMSDDDIQPVNGGFPSPDAGKLLNGPTISSWCQIIKEKDKLSALPSLVNAYRAACHYGAESMNSNASPRIQDQETFCSIIMFMLSEGDKLFRGLLGLSSNCKMDAIHDMKTTSKWKNLQPMIKSYLNSTLFLLNQFTETDILAFSLTRLRASLIFFATFPSLRWKLIEVAVHLWATGGGALSSCSFLILHDVPSLFGLEYYDKCLKKAYQAMISRCKVVDPTSLKHVEYLTSSFVELCSLDLRKSVNVATLSIQKIARILQSGFETNEEALMKICSWEYALCIDLWVTFLSVNIKDNDLHGPLYTIIQVINGVANLFSAQKYLPLRIKCIQWLNRLSSSSGIFIPVSSLVLDILESSPTKEVEKRIKEPINLSTTLKLPKYWLKSRDCQVECVFATIELLSAHFLQWSHHITFPELATFPVLRLKQYHDKSTAESLRRTLKRLIDQVEKNIDFVQRKREDVAFSPNDQASADSFLQIERSSSNSPYIQYYNSIIQNATTRKVSTEDSTSSVKQKSERRKKRKLPQKTKDASANGEGKSVKISTGPSMENGQVAKSKKQKT